MNRPKEYRTKQRNEILSYIEENGSRHITAADITEHFKSRGVAIGAATVYRNLDRLTADGFIRKYTSGDNTPACYQLAAKDCHQHHHLRCLECGALIHLNCDLLDSLGEHIKEEHGFVLDKTKTVLYGLCSRCAGKGNS